MTSFCPWQMLFMYECFKCVSITGTLNQIKIKGICSTDIAWYMQQCFTNENLNLIKHIVFFFKTFIKYFIYQNFIESFQCHVVLSFPSVKQRVDNMYASLQESEEGEQEPNPLPPDSVNGNSPKSSEDGQISPVKEEMPLNTSNKEIIPEKVQPMTLTPPISQLPLVSEVRLRRSVSDVNVNKKPDKQTKSYAGLPPPGSLKHTNSQVYTNLDIFVSS